MNDWMTCPVCGTRAVIIEGGYTSMLGCGRTVKPDDPEFPTLPLGQVGTEWYGFSVENDRIEWPDDCPGYAMYLEDGQKRVRHLTEEDQ